MHNVTAGVLMLELTGSPLLVGVVSAATFLPMLLLGLPAGALSDAVDRRLVVLATQSVSLAVATALTVVTALGRLGPALLVVGCALIGTSYALSKPSMSAMLPALVRRPEIPEATAFNTLQFNLGQVLGPAVSAALLLAAGPAWAFGTNAATFAAPLLAMRLLPRSVRGPAAGLGRDGGSGGVRSGLRFVRRTTPMTTVLVAVVLTNGATESLRTLAPALSGALGREAGAAGILVVGYSAGAFAGLLGFGLVRRLVPAGALLAVAFALQAAGALGVAAAPALPVAVAAGTGIGFGFAVAVPLLNAALQTLSTDEFRGRVMSVFAMAHMGFRPVFAVLAGGIASLAGPRAAMAGFAALAAAAGLLGGRRRLRAVAGR